MTNKFDSVYPSALSNKEWQLIMPHLPNDNLLGWPREHDWRDILIEQVHPGEICQSVTASMSSRFYRWRKAKS